MIQGRSGRMTAAVGGRTTAAGGRNTVQKVVATRASREVDYFNQRRDPMS